MELLVTEGRNAYGANRGRNTVRVFLQRDYNYGYWIAEDKLFNLLNKDQQEQYANGIDYDSSHFDIGFETATKILEFGNTPYYKQKLYKE